MVRRAERTFARKINILQFACGGSPLLRGGELQIIKLNIARGPNKKDLED